jgi:hypothetical protein
MLRMILLAPLLAFPMTAPAAHAAPPRSCASLPGAASDWTIALVPAGGGRMAYRATPKPGTGHVAPAFLLGGDCFKFATDAWVVKNNVLVPDFSVPAAGAAPVPSAEPVLRVTVEFASGRREVVE